MEYLSNVQQFYLGKNVFITGATGFIGKILVEKLLRCCPGIQKLYLLMREKKGHDIHSRFNKIINEPIFHRLQVEFPEFREKIVLIAGDCSEVNLGLSATDRKIIVEQVNVIFHLAATVKFNEHLRIAHDINVRATSDLIQMAKTMQNLKVFMQISTAYSNSHLPFVEEKFYPLVTDWSYVGDIVRNQTDGEILRILPKILGPMPNTYTFTKALAENEILVNSQNLPIGIFRPAIVISTAKEPIENWVDNLSGPTGVIVGCGSGLIRTMQCDKDVVAEIVPADYVVNCLIVATRDVHEAYNQSPMFFKPRIYNYVSSVENKITWGEFVDVFVSGLHDFPFSRAIWYNFLNLSKYSAVHLTGVLFLHVIPALIVDLISILLLKNTRMMKAVKKIHMFSSLLIYFTTTNIKFCNQRTRQLWEDCSDSDKQIFPFSISELKWSEYFESYVLGIRRYIVKDNDGDLKQARRRYIRLYYLHYTFKFLLFVSLLGLFIFILF